MLGFPNNFGPDLLNSYQGEFILGLIKSFVDLYVDLRLSQADKFPMKNVQLIMSIWNIVSKKIFCSRPFACMTVVSNGFKKNLK